MNSDVKIIRELASRYAEIANNPIIQERIILHRGVNDLKPIRPVVLISELPWNELNIDGELTLMCKDKEYQEVEQYLRKTLFQWKYFQADMIVPNYYGVQKLIHTTGTGIEIKGEYKQSNEGGILSKKYNNQIIDKNSLEVFHKEIITYKEEETIKKYNKIAEAIGTILPVKITGFETGYEIGCKNWDIIAELMGAEEVFLHLADEPELMHLLVDKLTEIFIDSVKQYETLNLFEPNQLYLHGTTALTTQLSQNVDSNHVTTKNLWGRGLAQIFASVSKAMRDEFDISYMKKAMEPFGLVYYGCCEPLHNMIDILSKIDNLRKISITPWADVDVAAEFIGEKYVLASKVNPAYLLNVDIYEEEIRKELKGIFKAVKLNNCACDIALKDISTLGNNLENIVKWEKIAMEMVHSY